MADRWTFEGKASHSYVNEGCQITYSNMLTKGTAGIAQSVQQLASGWTVWGQIPVGDEIFPYPSISAPRPTQFPVQ